MIVGLRHNLSFYTIYILYKLAFSCHSSSRFLYSKLDMVPKQERDLDSRLSLPRHLQPNRRENPMWVSITSPFRNSLGRLTHWETPLM